MHSASSIFVQTSKMRNSIVGNFGWGRTSHQICVGSSMHRVRTRTFTSRSYSA